jgi:hypothetical protein
MGQVPVLPNECFDRINNQIFQAMNDPFDWSNDLSDIDHRHESLRT